MLLHSLNRTPMIGAAATAWFAKQSPDRLDLFASADSRVFCFESHALGERCCADESAARIARIVRRKLVGQNGNLHRDRLDGSPLADLLDKGFHRSGTVQSREWGL